MLNWLRRTVGWLERRWIRDTGERARHDTRVRERLGVEEPGPERAASTPPTPPADGSSTPR